MKRSDQISEELQNAMGVINNLQDKDKKIAKSLLNKEAYNSDVQGAKYMASLGRDVSNIIGFESESSRFYNEVVEKNVEWLGEHVFHISEDQKTLIKCKKSQEELSKSEDIRKRISTLSYYIERLSNNQKVTMSDFFTLRYHRIYRVITMIFSYYSEKDGKKCFKGKYIQSLRFDLNKYVPFIFDIMNRLKISAKPRLDELEYCVCSWAENDKKYLKQFGFEYTNEFKKKEKQMEKRREERRKREENHQREMVQRRMETKRKRDEQQKRKLNQGLRRDIEIIRRKFKKAQVNLENLKTEKRNVLVMLTDVQKLKFEDVKKKYKIPKGDDKNTAINRLSYDMKHIDEEMLNLESQINQLRKEDAEKRKLLPKRKKRNLKRKRNNTKEKEEEEEEEEEEKRRIIETVSELNPKIPTEIIKKEVENRLKEKEEKEKKKNEEKKKEEKKKEEKK